MHVTPSIANKVNIKMSYKIIAIKIKGVNAIKKPLYKGF